jgi:SAM-dependent methyltransferase
MVESFRPVSNDPPDSFAGKLKFYGRMVLDLQMLTVYRDMKKTLPHFKGMVLDVGCGRSPYAFLLDAVRTQYVGIDIADAKRFDYDNSRIVPFNGLNIPFESEKFDGVICTEVLEHVHHYQALVDEIYRVMKKGSSALITVPWSARNHYVPYDYFRYTPSGLTAMFSRFSTVSITTRGSDIACIANKLTVLWARHLVPRTLWNWLFVPFWIAGTPLLLCSATIAHLSLLLHFGSTDDPLGYTILVTK